MEQLLDMMPSLNAIGVSLIAFSCIATFVVMVLPSRPLNYEMVDGKKVALDVFEGDNDQAELGIGAHSYEDAQAMRIESATARNLYQKRLLTETVVQTALDRRNPDLFVFKNLDSDDDT